MTILKKSLNALMWIGVATIVAIGVLHATKVTDPRDPRFDPLRFKFTDYTADTWSDPIQVMFPLGTERAFIERVLVDSAGAEIVPLTERYIRYMKPVPWANLNSYSVYVIYDDASRLLAIRTNRKNILNTELLDEARARLYPSDHRQERHLP